MKRHFLLSIICLVQLMNKTYAAEGVTPISQLPTKTAPVAASNLLVIVDQPGVVGGTKKITVGNFANGLDIAGLLPTNHLPYVTVSAKGIVNGLSLVKNDGLNFGPDTIGTTTCGLKEAFNALTQVSSYGTNTGGGRIALAAGTYICTGQIIIPNDFPFNVAIEGAGKAATQIIYRGSGSNDFIITSRTLANGQDASLNLIAKQIGFYYVPDTNKCAIMHLKFVNEIHMEDCIFASYQALQETSAGLVYRANTPTNQLGIIGLRVDGSANNKMDFYHCGWFGLAVGAWMGTDHSSFNDCFFGCIGSYATNGVEGATGYGTLWKTIDSPVGYLLTNGPAVFSDGGIFEMNLLDCQWFTCLDAIQANGAMICVKNPLFEDVVYTSLRDVANDPDTGGVTYEMTGGNQMKDRFVTSTGAITTTNGASGVFQGSSDNNIPLWKLRWKDIDLIKVTPSGVTTVNAAVSNTTALLVNNILTVNDSFYAGTNIIGGEGGQLVLEARGLEARGQIPGDQLGLRINTNGVEVGAFLTSFNHGGSPNNVEVEVQTIGGIHIKPDLNVANDGHTAYIAMGNQNSLQNIVSLMRQADGNSGYLSFTTVRNFADNSAISAPAIVATTNTGGYAVFRFENPGPTNSASGWIRGTAQLLLDTNSVTVVNVQSNLSLAGSGRRLVEADPNGKLYAILSTNAAGGGGGVTATFDPNQFGGPAGGTNIINGATVTNLHVWGSNFVGGITVLLPGAINTNPIILRDSSGNSVFSIDQTGGAIFGSTVDVTNRLNVQGTTVIGTNQIHSTNMFQVAVPVTTSGANRKIFEVNTNGGTFTTAITNSGNVQSATLNTTGAATFGNAITFGTAGSTINSAGTAIDMRGSGGNIYAGNSTVYLGTLSGLGANGSGFASASTGAYGWVASGGANGTIDTEFYRVAPGVVGMTNRSAASLGGWIQWHGLSQLATNMTTTSATLGTVNMNTVVNLQAGRTYSIEAYFFVSDSTAADGGQIAWDGGGATATDFRGQFKGDGTVVTGATVQSTALATAFSPTFGTTGNGLIEFHGTITVNAAGTFIPRFAQGSHSSGTLTLFRGSRIELKDMP